MVVYVVEVVAVPQCRSSEDMPCFEKWVLRETRRLTFSQIRKDKAQLFFHRIVLELYTITKRLRLVGLLDTLAGAVKFPAMETASDTVAFYPSYR
jgi:hypothetical protein